jgi:hypothetical protein
MFDKHLGVTSGGLYDAKVTRVMGRCPACRKSAVFDVLYNVQDVVIQRAGKAGLTTGQRVCPNPACRCFVFFTCGNAGADVVLYPPETLDFDNEGLPKTVLDALEEAVMCHAASCYRAAAMMVRKTLEELCLDQQITKGNLKDKVKELCAKIVIPVDLVAGIDDLRLLGNDAAHVSAQDFNQVGKDEVETAIDLAKELLRATYQHKALVARMKAHKI